jgi:hypothetical protein
VNEKRRAWEVEFTALGEKAEEKTATVDRRYGRKFPIVEKLARRVLDCWCRDAPGGPTEMP